MARIRTIKPEMFQDEKLAPMDVTTRFVFLGLISMADDAGRVLDNARVIDAFVFPETDDSAREALARLSRIGRIRRGKTASGQRILEICNWSRHQKVDHPNLKQAFPELVEIVEVTEIREPFARDSRGIREPLAHHTNDQRPVPTTNDLGAARAKKRAPSEKGDTSSKFPEFPTEARNELYDVWREKVGDVNMGMLVNAVGPYWTTDRGPAVRRAVRDYVALITSGRSAPFASPPDLAKKLGALITNAERNAADAIARSEGAERIIHGRAA